MRSLFTLVTLFVLSTPSVVRAGSSCVAFDTAWNLLAFGFNGKDYNAGTSDSWASGFATDITATGRPPFNGNNTKCYLAEFFNAIYVLGADTSQPSAVYIYDATKKSWSTQAVTAGTFDASSFEAILDHDTNFFYALSKGSLFSLDMGSLTSANSTPLAWSNDEAAQITTTNYDPVMGIAQNHIYFFGVPGVAAGSAPIFVIHFSFWQPGAQQYGSFPDSHGQATSFFLDSGVQTEIAFIPDDGSNTYIVNVDTNTTQTIAGPPIVDAGATYFASTTALVQLASSGAVSWLPYSASSSSDNSAAKWSTVQKLAAVAPPTGGSSSASASGASGSAKSTATKSGSGGTGSGGSAATGSASGSAAAPSGSSAARRELAWGSGTALGLVGVALALL
ncbi:hypothetical protein B0H10DRAFT_1832920 [Mycena sp. CBHHK59/15]|nr:hypothetical protein B0H10DRAFT_1832920 [Mycena sp. CBHHK59/15]